MECAGEINLKCIKLSSEKWIHHTTDALHVFLGYLDCYNEELKECNFPISQHYNAVLQAFKTHLQEKHGLLGGMVEKINMYEEL